MDWVKRTSARDPRGVNSPLAFRLESALLCYKTIDACLLERVLAIKVGLPADPLVVTGVHFHASVRFKANQTSPNCNDLNKRGTLFVRNIMNSLQSISSHITLAQFLQQQQQQNQSAGTRVIVTFLLVKVKEKGR